MTTGNMVSARLKSLNSSSATNPQKSIGGKENPRQDLRTFKIEN
jgi:hypothetical protein